MKDSFQKSFAKFQKIIISSLFGLIGILLVLAGLDLISISPTLVLYSGIFFLAFALVFYFLL